jgi:hypothetical protein
LRNGRLCYENESGRSVELACEEGRHNQAARVPPTNTPFVVTAGLLFTASSRETARIWDLMMLA